MGVCPVPLYPRHAVHRIAQAVRRRCTAFCGALLLGDAAPDLAPARPNPADGIPDFLRRRPKGAAGVASGLDLRETWYDR
jgi:hypothetical protein